MRIPGLYGRGRPVFSFEFFPPKTDAGFASLFHTLEDLKRLDPDWVSVTWGAGGGTRRKTIELVVRIQREIGLTAMAHLTCVGATADSLAETLDELERKGVENVLALRGDPPADQPEFRPEPGGFAHASELARFIRSRWPFALAGACYPETHQEAASPEADLAALREKVEAGVELLISQLFFDNRDFFDFVDRARAAGIATPIVPGIMPVTSTANIRRITSLCGARIPAALEARLDACGADDERTLQVGVEWATAQCRELLARGVPGIHFYTLNRSPATRRVFEGLSLA
jgi:methylenetetrahydrofolate reductase (NADPH)